MPRTAILRYSNAEGPTVTLHEAIIHSGGGVWWGWWKKETEPFPGELLAHLMSEASDEAPVRIGLLNRKDGEYVAADCTAIEFGATGQTISCPEPALCPDYYRTADLVAWFRFKRFDRLNDQRFKLEFGAIPELDPTLYDVIRIGSEFTILPRPVWSLDSVKTRGPRILHLSDLHFGDFHGYAETEGGSGIGQRSLRTILRERLGAIGSPSVGVVVVSGDLISKGDANAFSPAKDFLDSVVETLDLSREHVVLVPGNHDIWREGVQNPTRDYAHEKPYREFLESFYHRDIQDLEWIQRFEADEWDLIFFTLNSARLRTETITEYGYVGRHRYEQMLRFISETLGDRPSLDRRQLLIGVLHHHLLPTPLVSVPEPDRPISLTLDAGEILSQFQHSGVHLALHGHQHVPFIGTSARVDMLRGGDSLGRPVSVMGGGSAGAAMEHLLQEAPYNTLGLYTPTASGLSVVVEAFTASTDPQEMLNVNLPLH